MATIFGFTRPRSLQNLHHNTSKEFQTPTSLFPLFMLFFSCIGVYWRKTSHSGIPVREKIRASEIWGTWRPADISVERERDYSLQSPALVTALFPLRHAQLPHLIGTMGEVYFGWPSRSPVLTHLVFYLWSYLKKKEQRHWCNCLSYSLTRPYWSASDYISSHLPKVQRSSAIEYKSS